jgi:hypothetical protein
MGMIEKCTKTAQQAYDEIGQEEEICDNGDSANDVLQKSDYDDNSATNSEKISIIQVAI